ncbi:MAG: ABC transporter permease subunit [Planctomycetota bacterium]
MPQLLRTSVLRSIGLFVLLFGHLAIAIAFYPTFLEQKGALLAMAEGVSKILARDAALAAKSDWGYVCGQQFFKFSNTLGTGAAVMFAAGAVASDTQRGTLELVLSRPVSRTRLYLERWIAGALALAVPMFLVSALFRPLCDVLGVTISVPTSLMLEAAAYETAFLSIFYSVAFTWSVFAPRVLTIVLGLIFGTIGMYALYLIPDANAWSIYQWADVRTFFDMQSRPLSATQWLRPLAISAAVALVGWYGFRRRAPY